MSLQQSINNYNKAFRLYDKINAIWSKIESGQSTNSEFEISQLLMNLSTFRKYLNGIYIEDFKTKFDLNKIEEIKHNLALFNEGHYFIERNAKGIKYADDLKPAVGKFISDMRLESREIQNWGRSEDDVAKKFIAAITNNDNVLDYENEIRRMMKGKMSKPEFSKIYNTMRSSMIKWNKGTFQTLKKWKEESLKPEKKKPAYGFRIKK